MNNNAQKNIFELYMENNEKVPFIVRRESWDDTFGYLVTAVAPNDLYGISHGFPLPPLDKDKSVSDYWGVTGVPSIMKNSGSYQWEKVEDIPNEWKCYFIKE